MPPPPDGTDTDGPDTAGTDAAGDQPALVMTGDIDIGTESEWKQRGLDRLEADPQLVNLVVDMRDVGFIDSRGMAVLVALHAAALQRGGTLALRAVPRRVVKALSVAGLESVFDISSTSTPE